ncbi:alpha/beta fold hydrolase [Paraferrimonas sedimenticola]|uniref:AB hydrolase-1 domain-containing protein n=1 Tax=Paraferrimonas sedimenticola TaxID=375674 RepID=A0AA37W0Z8_9GAMM|nr:alpha/beta hydrolase [Paraferrimonas sedimenticola]GLP96388.1 hypothetical protein GCM10007895_16940 [Paraferrimonas sedimenticola]
MLNLSSVKLTITAMALSVCLSACSSISVKEHFDNAQLESAGFHQRHVELSEGGQLSYWIGGQGEPVLLLHGFGGNATTTWLPVMLSLSENFLVIAPDLVWFGDSFSEGAATITTQRNAINQLMSHVNTKAYNVVGISYGGFVAYDMMVKQAGISKVVLIASPGTFITDQQMSALSQRFEREHPSDIFVPDNREQMRQLFDRTFAQFPDYPSFIDEQIFQRYFAPWKAQKRGLIDSLPTHRDHLLPMVNPEKLPASLVIWGADDQVFTLEQGESLAEFLNAPLLVIPKAPHNIANEHPFEVSKAIKQFINQT